MIKNLSLKQLVTIFLTLDFIFLLLYSSTMSISIYEAEVIFLDSSLLTKFLEGSMWIFGQNDFAIRVPFIIIHMLNIILLYNLAKKIVKKDYDALFAVILYSLLPGVNSSALVVDKVGVVILFTLIFLNLFHKYRRESLILLFLLAFLDQAFLLLFFALIFYGVNKKDVEVLITSLVGFTLNYYLFGFEDGGIPQGHFLEIFGIYGAIFSPLVFLYYIYSLYWFLIKYKKPLPALWYISFIIFILSIVLSLRQIIEMEDFALFAVIATPIMTHTVMNSYRSRLPGFRKRVILISSIVIGTLALNTFITFFNKPLYLLLKDPTHHFAYPHHFIKELSDELKKEGVFRVTADTKEIQLRLKFYGIEEGGKRLSQEEFENAQKISLHIIADRKMDYFLSKD